jgi:hypothetical protein
MVPDFSRTSRRSMNDHLFGSAPLLAADYWRIAAGFHHEAFRAQAEYGVHPNAIRSGLLRQAKRFEQVARRKQWAERR